MGGSSFAGGRGEGDRHGFTGVQQSAIESRVWRGVEAPGQWKTNTQTDADVLTAAEALCENKTGRINRKNVRSVAPGRRNTLERRSSRRSRGRLMLF